MTTPRLRRSLQRIPSYKPGRIPRPAADRPTYKLSSNENPYAPIPEIVDAIATAATRVNRYPDTSSGRLATKLSEHFEVPASGLVVATGSAALIYHIVQAFCEPGDEVIYAWRSFEAYPIAVQVPNAVPVQVPLAPGARHDLDAMAAAITDRTRVIFVCTPNNPTGPVVRHDELVAFLDRVPEHVLVVIDEAYVQFVRDPAAADGLALYREGRPNVCLLRTFSKAYGLANMRTGFAIAPEEITSAIRVCTLPFPVSTVAEEASLAALACEDVLFERVEELVKERTRVLDGLRGIGWEIPDSESNFVWFGLDDDPDHADRFAMACEAEGVVVRAFAGDGCRVTVAEPEANDIVLSVAERFLNESNGSNGPSGPNTPNSPNSSDDQARRRPDPA